VSTNSLQLLTIPFSHFSEKGRWAMDRSGAVYREIRFAPVVQRMAVMPFGSLTVPVLLNLPHVVRGSNEILKFADDFGSDDERLFPLDSSERAEVEALVQRFDDAIAPNVRLWFYSWATADPERLKLYGCHGLPPIQKKLMESWLAGISKMLRMHFKLDEETHARAAGIVTAEMEFVSGLLADGREYLVGGRFSAADLAFAAFTGNAVSSPEYGGWRYSPPPKPDDLVAQSDEWIATPAGQWVRRIYADHRMQRTGRPNYATV
jgi:glutathione S-transferase